MNNMLGQMIAKLSDEDKLIFNDLAEKLKKVDGKVELLSEDDLLLIREMESKYGSEINKVHEEESSTPDEIDLLRTGFAQFVRQILARDLVKEFPMEGDAVGFVFENKWLPIDCQDDSLVSDVFEKYREDIIEANQWRDELVSVDDDKKMAVGLAWFMVVYQLNKRLNEE
ncbi:hypothetical protein [Aliikangiella sp. G2MR2-5]|uniref:hypothetical protein n=1 Tax=Aliikangiella sp. G2MR2-5 TaxID=2788943 RepID=UPI0018A9F247|nr:hypothetical protein [Aliikangiella sp. G2MR2-5]